MGRLIRQALKALLWLVPLGRGLSRITKSIPAIVEATEQLWKDGKIDVSERKIIATKAIEIIAKDNNIKFNWLIRILVSIIINLVAKELPVRDLSVSEVLLEAIKDVKGI